MRASFDACDSVQSYNAYVALCANVAEKFLKAVIEMCFVDEEDAIECQQILESIFKDVTDILYQQRIENEKTLKELERFRAFQHADR